MKNLISKIWNGKLDLIKTFWLVNVLGSSILSIPIILGDIYYDSLNNFTSLIVLIFLILLLVYFIFVTVSTWRSATNFINLKKKKKQKVFWGYAAKTVVVLGVIRAIGTTLSALFV